MIPGGENSRDMSSEAHRLYLDARIELDGRPAALALMEDRPLICYWLDIASAAGCTLELMCGPQVGHWLVENLPPERLQPGGDTPVVILEESALPTESHVIPITFIPDDRAAVRVLRHGGNPAQLPPVWEVKSTADLALAAESLVRRRHYPLAACFHLPLGNALARMLVPTPISANQLTAFRSLLGFAIAAALAWGDYPWRVVAGVGLHIYLMLDFCDGHLARLKGQVSVFGALFEQWSDFLNESLWYLALGFGLWWRGSPIWVLWVAIAVVLGNALSVILGQMQASMHAPKTEAKVAAGTEDDQTVPGRGFVRRVFGRAVALLFAMTSWDARITLAALVVWLNQPAWILVLMAAAVNLAWLRMLMLEYAARRK